MEYYEELTYALKHLSVVQSFYYAGRLEAYKENCGSRIDCDEDFLYANWWELLEAAADFVDVRWDESETCERLYFSDAVIRRCLSQVQKHADNLGIRLKTIRIIRKSAMMFTTSCSMPAHTTAVFELLRRRTTNVASACPSGSTANSSTNSAVC